MSGSGVAVLDMRKDVPQNSQVARSFFKAAAESAAPQLGQVSAFMVKLYDNVVSIRPAMLRLRSTCGATRPATLIPTRSPLQNCAG